MTQWRSLAEWVGFQLVWFACALGAAHGQSAPGVIAAALFVGAVLASKPWSYAECLAILASGTAGLIAESALAAAELVRFAAPWPSAHVAPPWMVALWLAFGATLPAMASLLGRHPGIKASLLGLIGGPLAYWAGARLGALEVVGAAPLTYLVIALIWAVTLPALLMLREKAVR